MRRLAAPSADEGAQREFPFLESHTASGPVGPAAEACGKQLGEITTQKSVQVSSHRHDGGVKKRRLEMRERKRPVRIH